MFQKIESILVIRLDRLGDLVLSLPAISSLRKNFPRAKITALVNKPFGGFLVGYGFADEAIEFDAEKNKTLAKKAGFLSSLGKRSFDFAIDLQHAKNDFSALALLSTKAKIKAGYAIGLRRLTANRPVGLSPEILQEKEHSLAILRCLGLKTVENISLKRNKIVEEKIRVFIKRHAKRNSLLVGVHAGVSGDVLEKAWPKENFAEICRMLSERLGATVFLTGTKSEEILLDFIVEKSRGAAIKANNFSLSETTELIRKLDLFICNNTGTMHIASALGKKIIVINAFSNPKRWLPEKNAVMLVKKPECWPCEKGKKIKCGRGFECIRGVSAKEAFEAAKKALK